MEYNGPLILLPTAIVLILALWSRRALEPLIFGAVVGTAMIAPGNILGSLAEDSLAVMTNGTVAWVILVCGLMGSVIALLLRSGPRKPSPPALRASSSAGNPRCWLRG